MRAWRPRSSCWPTRSASHWRVSTDAIRASRWRSTRRRGSASAAPESASIRPIRGWAAAGCWCKASSTPPRAISRSTLPDCRCRCSTPWRRAAASTAPCRRGPASSARWPTRGSTPPMPRRMCACAGLRRGCCPRLRCRVRVRWSVAVTGAIDLAPFAPLFGNQIRNVAGTLRSNLTVEIAGPKISGAGTIDFANGALSFPEIGLRLSGGAGRLVLQGDTVQLQQLSFDTGRNGALTASGTIRLDAADGLAVALAVTSRRALLVNRADLVATVSSDLKVTGSTGAGFDVAGPVKVDRAEIAVGAGQTASFPTLEVREINKPAAANGTTTPPPAATPRKPPRAPSATAVRLALDVQAPQAVFVRGRGLDAEVGGAFQVTGDPGAPAVIGGLTLRRGDLSLAGRRLVFSRGVVSLDNADRIDPRLDFLASATVQSTTVQIAITGTARAPVIAVTSIPTLPSDEALALLLFGKPASSLSAFELISVAQTLAELTGTGGGGTGFMGRMRQTLGLDQLRVGSSNSS